MSFSDFDLETLDRVVIAHREILQASGRIVAWAGTRIYRSEVISPPKGVAVPAVFVCGVRPDEVEEGVGCLNIDFRTVTGLVWRSPRRALLDDEPSVASVVVEVCRLYRANPLLKVPKFGNRPQARRLVDWKIPKIEPIRQTEESVDGFVTIETVHRLQLNPATWEHGSHSA